MVKLTVDGKQLEVEEGIGLLQACLDNDIYIPNLCYLKGMQDPPTACRLCFVEIEGEPKPVTSCNAPVREGMVVRTDSDAVRDMQRSVFQLIFSAHHMECKNCLSRKNCELQKIAKLLGIRLKARKPDELGRDPAVAPEHPCFDLRPARCVLCYKCLYVCQERQGEDESLLRVERKGFDTAIGFAGEGDPENLPCSSCNACVDICPVSAITPKKEKAPEASTEAGA